MKRLFVAALLTLAALTSTAKDYTLSTPNTSVILSAKAFFPAPAGQPEPHQQDSMPLVLILDSSSLQQKICHSHSDSQLQIQLGSC